MIRDGKRIYISDAIRRNIVKNGYELQESDLNHPLNLGWGKILPVDIGKRCYIIDGLFYMENNEQRDKRKAKENK